MLPEKAEKRKEEKYIANATGTFFPPLFRPAMPLDWKSQ